MDLGKMMGMFGDMKEKMEASKMKLDSIMVNGEAEGVKVTMSASKAMKDIVISDSLFAEGDKDKLQDMILSAIGKAQNAADDVAHREASQMAQGGDIGSIMNMFS